MAAHRRAVDHRRRRASPRWSRPPPRTSAPLAARAIAARGRFRIALAGGSTPRALYPTLVDAVDWTRTDVFFGDERAVPPDDPQSNYRMARETLLDPRARPGRERLPLARRVARPRRRGARLRTGAARGRRAALAGPGAARPRPRRAHRVAVSRHVRAGRRGPPGRRGRRAGARHAPADAHLPRAARARDVCFLVTGAEKASALADVSRPGSDLPAARIVQRPGPVTIFCDAGAARSQDTEATGAMMVLAGDIGGTNARLAIYDVPAAGAARRRCPSSSRRIPRRRYASLDVIAEEFVAAAAAANSARAPRSTSACFGIAGPIENNICRATNLPWVVDGRRAVAAARDRPGDAGQRLLRGGAGRHRRRRRRAGRARRRPAASRTGRSPSSAPEPASARPSCSGRPPRTATRSSPPRAATSISPRARRWSRAWCTS